MSKIWIPKDGKYAGVYKGIVFTIYSLHASRQRGQTWLIKVPAISKVFIEGGNFTFKNAAERVRTLIDDYLIQKRLK